MPNYTTPPLAKSRRCTAPVGGVQEKPFLTPPGEAIPEELRFLLPHWDGESGCKYLGCGVLALAAVGFFLWASFRYPNEESPWIPQVFWGVIALLMVAGIVVGVFGAMTAGIRTRSAIRAFLETGSAARLKWLHRDLVREYEKLISSEPGVDEIVEAHPPFDFKLVSSSTFARRKSNALVSWAQRERLALLEEARTSGQADAVRRRAVDQREAIRKERDKRIQQTRRACPKCRGAGQVYAGARVVERIASAPRADRCQVCHGKGCCSSSRLGCPHSSKNGSRLTVSFRRSVSSPLPRTGCPRLAIDSFPFTWQSAGRLRVACSPPVAPLH